MYCLCFREGKKCNKNLCKCDGCENIIESKNDNNPVKHKGKKSKEKKSKNTTVSTVNTNR
jgi:hypothetical protein